MDCDIVYGNFDINLLILSELEKKDPVLFKNLNINSFTFSSTSLMKKKPKENLITHFCNEQFSNNVKCKENTECSSVFNEHSQFNQSQFKNKKNQRHFIEKNTKFVIKCPNKNCGKFFTSKTGLRQHIRRNKCIPKEKYIYNCICGKTYTTLKGLEHHRKKCTFIN